MRKEGEKRKIRMLITIMASLSPANLGRKLQEQYKMTGGKKMHSSSSRHGHKNGGMEERKNGEISFLLGNLHKSMKMHHCRKRGGDTFFGTAHLLISSKHAVLIKQVLSLLFCFPPEWWHGNECTYKWLIETAKKT